MEAKWGELEACLLHRCIVDSGSCASTIAELGGYEWAEPEHGWLWKQVVETYEATGESPSMTALRAAVLALPPDLHDPLNDALDGIATAVPEARPRVVARMLAKRQTKRRVLTTIDRATKRFEKGQDEAALALLDRTFAGGVVSSSRPSARPLVPKNLLHIPGAERIPTGLYALDEVIDGIGRGELGIVFGVTGHGKSSLGVSLDFAAIRQGFRVLHVDSENGERVTTSRVISRFTRIPHALIESGSYSGAHKQLLTTWLKRNHKRLAEQLQVLYIGVEQATVADVEAAWTELEARGFIPDLVVFDSPDHLKMGEGGTFDPKYGWAYLTTVYRRLAGLAQRHDAGLWVMTQADKSAEGKMAGTRHLRGAQSKGEIASIVLSVNMPEDPNLDRETHRDIWISKGRTRRARFRVQAVCDFSRMLIKAPPVSDT